MEKKEKLWIVTELFSPDQTSTAFILKGISDFLIETRAIEVICGPTNDKQTFNQNSFKEISDIKITRIKSFNLNKNNLLLRSFRLMIISLQLSAIYLIKSKRNESVLIVTNPAPLLLIFALISKLSKRKINVLVHDVFPENTLPAKIFTNHKSLPYRLLKNIFDYAYSQFDTLIVLGRDMKLILSNKVISKNKKKPKIIIVENWADIDDVYPLKPDNLPLEKWGVSNKFVFLFAGNLGRTQALDELFLIINRVTNSLLHFVFLGDGALKDKLIHFKEINNLSNVTIGSSFPRSEQGRILNACNAGIVTLAKGMEGLGVPSKSYNILASGKPILYFGDKNSEISLLVKENKIGWSFNSSESLLDFLNQIDESFFESSKILGLRSRDIAESQYSKLVILEKFKEVIC